MLRRFKELFTIRQNNAQAIDENTKQEIKAKKLLRKIEGAKLEFREATDPNVIDLCIFTVASLEKEYEDFLKKSKLKSSPLDCGTL